MADKTPIRTVFDGSGNATGLAEFQTGETVPYEHGGTGLSALGTSGQVLQVNSGADGLEWGTPTQVNLNPYLQVANATATFSTLTQLGNTNSYIASVQSNLDTTNTNVAQKLGGTASVTLTGDVTASGSFSANAISLTTDIAASGTPTGTFGSASKVPIITVGADGRITNISNTNVAGVTGFTYTAANNTFAISTADGGSFTASVDELDNYALTSTINATFSTLTQLGNTNSYIASVQSNLDATNANVDQKLGATATVTLSGDVSGSASFSSNSVSITTTVADDSHNHSSSSGAFTVGTDLTVSGGDIILSGTGRIQGIDTVSAGTDAASKTYVDNAVAGVVDSAPEALNTLNELAAALGDDQNFATTTATSLGTKAANSYVNATFSTLTQLGNTNSYIATKADATTQVIAGSGLTGGGTLAANRTLNIGAGTGITVAADSISTDDSAIVHDNLSGFVANEHIDHSTVSVTAGSGLTGGGTIAATRTINIGQGTGITVAADAISTNDSEIVHDNLSGFVANEHIDHSAVSVTAGSGLTGGGTIAATRTINVGAGTLIDVTADAVNVDLSELTTSTSDGDGDFFVVVDSANAQKKLTKANINISGFNNDAGYSTTTGTVTSVGVTAGTGLSGGGTVTTSGSVTLNVDLSELTDMTAGMIGTDEFIVLDGGADRRKAANEIGLSIFNNDAGFTTNVGDITAVTAGSGLTGGGTSGSVTLNIGAGTGISVAADSVGLAAAGAGAGTYGSTADGTKIDTITLDAYGRVTAVATGATGDIAGVTAGTGLTGGGTSGTVTLNVDTGTTANKIVQLNGSAQLPAVDGSLLTGISAGATVTDKSDNVNYNVVFTSETSGTQSLAGIDNGALIYNPSTGQLSATDFNSTSDVNLKDNIQTIDSPLDKINQLRGVNFNWKNNGNYAMGVIAQEVESVIPEVVNETDGTKGVNYGAMVGLLIEVVKDQQKQIDELKQIINNV